MGEYDHSVNVLEYLVGLELPATKIEIVQRAQDNGAPEEALDYLQAMPDNTYNSVREIHNSLYLLEPLPDHGHLDASSAQDLSSDEPLAAGEGKMPLGAPATD